MPWPPREFIVVGFARTRLAQDDGSVSGYDLTWEFRAVQRQHGPRGSGPHRRLLSQHLVWTERPQDGGQLPSRWNPCNGTQSHVY